MSTMPSSPSGDLETKDPAIEGSPAEKTQIAYEGNRIPLPLLIAWLVLFVWIVGYVVTYLLPALPK